MTTTNNPGRERERELDRDLRQRINDLYGALLTMKLKLDAIERGASDCQTTSRKNGSGRRSNGEART